MFIIVLIFIIIINNNNNNNNYNHYLHYNNNKIYNDNILDNIRCVYKIIKQLLTIIITTTINVFFSIALIGNI